MRCAIAKRKRRAGNNIATVSRANEGVDLVGRQPAGTQEQQPHPQRGRHRKSMKERYVAALFRLNPAGTASRLAAPINLIHRGTELCMLRDRIPIESGRGCISGTQYSVTDFVLIAETYGILYRFGRTEKF